VTAEELLDDLRRRGARLAAHSNVLHIEAPKGLLSPGLVASMRQLKPDLLRLVAPAPLTVGAVLGGVMEIQPSLVVAEICTMSLADFASASLVVEVWCKNLGEVVVLASDHAQVDPGERRAVYRARELSILSRSDRAGRAADGSRGQDDPSRHDHRRSAGQARPERQVTAGFQLGVFSVHDMRESRASVPAEDARHSARRLPRVRVCEPLRLALI
jgi:hypothetical protein